MKTKLLSLFILNIIACINTLLADTTLFDGSQKLSGVKIADDPEAAGNKTAHWEHAPKGYRIAMTNKTVDISQYNALSFRFYSKSADKHAFTVLVDSNKDSSGNYFSKTINIDWQGWKTVIIPFEDFSITRNVVGWNKVDKILFANSGYGAGKPNKDAVYYIDDIKAIKLKTPAKPKISLFNGSQRLSGVKIADDPQSAGNKVAYWENAPKGFRIAMLSKTTDLSKYKALSFRFYSKSADNHSFTVLVDSNKDSSGNYFTKTINIDWQGWKTVVIPFEDFSITRQVAGWNKVDKILFANSGYGAGKPNKDAVYYIDDIKALSTAPETPVLKKGETVTLTSAKTTYLHKFKTDPSKESIYGITFEYRGKPGAKVSMGDFRVYNSNHALKERFEGISLKKASISNEWQKGRIEILVKKDSSFVKFKLSMVGEIETELRNIETVKGGHPENPPLKEAPYLDWIDSLKVNFNYAQISPLLNFAKDGCQFWEYKKGRVVYLPDSKFKRFKDNTAPFMKLSVKELLDIIPEKRPFNYHGGIKGGLYSWDPTKSDKIYLSKTKEVYEPEKEFPVHGYEEVKTPAGKVVKYAYHDTAKDHKDYKGRRIYVEQFQNDAKLEVLTQVGIQLGMLYRRTGEIKYGIRSAAILWGIAKNMPNWPVHGKASWNAHVSEIKLQQPDFYSWFSFTMSGDWYVTSAGSLLYPCRYYAILNEKKVWEELSKEIGSENPRLETANGFLHMAKMILKRDAFYRNSKFVMFHNLSGSANRSLLQIGRMLGEPELVHYALRKINGSFQEVFMVDGVFPESQWYTLDQLVRQSQALDVLENYQDPQNYVSALDGTHLNISDPKESIPTYKTALEALKRQTFPDGTAYTIHDSWSETANPAIGKSSVMQFKERQENSPYLFREYGHGALGRGKAEHRIEAQLHYSGTYNHAHKDMLNLNFWAYGDELLSDIGYTHISSYATSSISHNLVIVNRSAQKKGHKGNLLSWSGRKGATQIIQADQGATPAYPECSIYRRALILLPFGDKQNAVLDIFEVEGGTEHDWMVNGCADYKQNVNSDLKAQKVLDNLAKDGKALENSYPWGDSQKDKYKQDEYGTESKFYGAFRNAKISPIEKEWTLTMSPGAAVPKDTPGAGPRAVSTEKKPSMKLHWLYPLNGQAALAEAPRNRYRNELHNKKEARAVWAKERMPKIIVNRKGKDLKSTFVALWEPHTDKPFIGKTENLKTKNDKGLAWKISENEIEKTVIYKAPELNGFVETGDIKSDAKFTVYSKGGNNEILDINDGSFASSDSLEIKLKNNEPVTVEKVTSAQGVHSVLLESNLSPNSPKYFKNQYVCFSQENDSNRWFKIKEVDNYQGKSRLILSQDPGFTFDSKTKILKETFFPRRTLYGSASIKLPDWLNIKSVKSDSETLLYVRASNHLELTLKNMNKDQYEVKIKRPDESWENLDFKANKGQLNFKIDFQKVSDEWIEISVK